MGKPGFKQTGMETRCLHGMSLVATKSIRAFILTLRQQPIPIAYKDVDGIKQLQKFSAGKMSMAGILLN